MSLTHVFFDIGGVRVPTDVDWYESDLGTNAFGQGLSVTPLQMIAAVAAVDAVIAASAGHEELQITQTTAGWTSVTPLQEVPVSPGP